MQKKTGLAARGVGGIFLLVGLGLLGGAVYTGNQQYAILKSWPTVDALTTKSRVTEVPSQSTGHSLYSVEIEFQYRVDGKEYVTVSSLPYATPDYVRMKRMADNFGIGTRRVIRYNPTNPGDIRFNAGYNFDFFLMPVLFGGMGLVFGLVGVAILWFARPKPELEWPPAAREALPAVSNDNRVLRLVGGIFFPLGLCFLAVAWYTGSHQYSILKSWPAVDAQVAQSRMIIQRSSKNRSTTYSAEMNFQYRADGKEYSTPASLDYSTGNYAAIKRMVDDYAPRTHHPIRYNPSDPNDIRFDAGYTLGFFLLPIIFGGMGLIFSGVGMGLLYASFSKTKRRCPSCGHKVGEADGVCPKCAAPLSSI